MTGERLIQLLIRMALVVIPTAVIGYVTLNYLNFSYTAFNTGVTTQTLYFSLGLAISYSLYYFRARWIITFLLLGLVYWLFGKMIAKLPGEFDVFYATARFELFSTVFLFGWLFGFLLARIRWAYVILSGILIVVTLIIVSNTVDVSLQYLLFHLLPVLVYGLYMFFLSPVLMQSIEVSWRKFATLMIRVVVFLALVLLAFVLVDDLFRGNLQAVEKELQARGAKENDDKGSGQKEGGYDERYGLMEKDRDGYRLRDTMRVNSRMNQSDNLVFCSKLDNYFPDGSPMPLYFVYHYLTKYDPVKESFIRDIDVPFFDEFDADPSAVPLYHTKSDSSVIRNSMGRRRRKVVNAEVYLASNTWKHSLLAPAGAFQIQPIAVEKDFQKTFISAYKVKSYASELNNAYFVYNPSANPMLEGFQEERHEELRNVFDYSNVDQKFYKYYTELPAGGLYDSITILSQRISRDALFPVDKVLAVRNFFLQKGANGKRIFRYTLKPGGISDPNIPNASMIANFLFNTHAGYCTYYAGASLLMLRSLGIPARFTTGFAAVNRSDKNKGWYWFYGSQAHAWTQVYFPGYGWLDFDMTIGNEDQQSAPKPDGTPPLPPPEPWLVINGVAATAPDLNAKRLDASFNSIIYFNQPYNLRETALRTVDASVCRIVYDKKDTTLATIHAGDSIVIVSYKDEAKKIPLPRKGVAIEKQVGAFPSPIIADEIHIKPKPEKKKEDEGRRNIANEKEKGMTIREMLALAGKTVLGLIVLFFLLPLLYLFYRLVRLGFAGTQPSRANEVYRSALYRLHMAGIERGRETPLEYAKMKVDPAIRAGFEEFMRTYLKLKYSGGQMEPADVETVNRFAGSVGKAIREKNGFFKLAQNYLNPLLAGRFFFRIERNDDENQMI